jgi:hypothetical protein
LWCGGGGGIGSGGHFSYYSCLFNPLNAELKFICHLLALLGAHHILHVSRIRVNDAVCSLGYRERSYWMAVKEELERLQESGNGLI